MRRMPDRAENIRQESSDVRAVDEQLSQGQVLCQIVPLCFRKVIKKDFWGILIIIIMGLIASPFVLNYVEMNSAQTGSSERGDLIWAGWVAILLLMLIWRCGYQLIYYWRYFYDMDGKEIRIRKGVIAQQEVTLPFAKVTDVYVDQDMLDVLLGLYDVHISTPTAQSGSMAHIDGVSSRGATVLREVFITHMNRANEGKS